jgi:hypothetical protein
MGIILRWTWLSFIGFLMIDQNEIFSNRDSHLVDYSSTQWDCWNVPMAHESPQIFIQKPSIASGNQVCSPICADFPTAQGKGVVLWILITKECLWFYIIRVFSVLWIFLVLRIHHYGQMTSHTRAMQPGSVRKELCNRCLFWEFLFLAKVTTIHTKM